MDVIIDGIVYVPHYEIKEVENENLNKALKELVSLYYFDDWHKAHCRVYDALTYLAPDLAEMACDHPALVMDILDGEYKC